MSTADTRPTVVQFTDPMCTWCWGSEPVLRRLRTAYGDDLRFEFVMGGLVEDFAEFHDAANDISDPGDVGPHWLEASEVHGMPVDVSVFETDPARSTYPASVAFVAARMQDRALAHRYLRRLREAYATQARNVNRRGEQVDLARAVGLDRSSPPPVLEFVAEYGPVATRDQYDHDVFDDRVEDAPDARYPAEAGRYHLYISRAYPWAHRTALVRRLLGLEDAVTVDVVDPVRRDRGWEFTPEKDGCTPDSVNGHDTLYEVFRTADPEYTGRVTVPVLYDTATDTIVNEESADIARLLATEFDRHAERDYDLHPADLRDAVDAAIADSHDSINTAVYRAGFAETQQAYETAVRGLFDALERWDEVLADRRYAVGDRLTLADLFLFPTLFRFDSVYHTHFNCNVRRLVDFDHLPGYARDIYGTPGVAETCNTAHVKAHYYRSHDEINPTGIVPVGPDVCWTDPHGRNRLPGEAPRP